MKILIIEDDPRIREELAKLLMTYEYEPIILTSFTQVVEQVCALDVHLILLDINLPVEDGYEICRKIKKRSTVPILFVTSRDSEEDELKSLLVGGDDFIRKPYNKMILLEKIKHALAVTNPIHYKELVRKGITLDLHLSLLRYRDQEVELTRNEFRILYYFFLHGDRVITKEELLEYLWNDKYYLDENILIVNINRLRRKASEIGIVDLIQTVRGKGYRL